MNPPSVNAPGTAARVRRCKVHNMGRVCPPLRAWANEWEFSGEFDLTVPPTGGTRYDDDQRALFAQGRTKPGPIVTYAESAADSAHGHAAGNDFHPVRELDAFGGVAKIYLADRLKEDPFVYDEALRRFWVMATHAERFGLESGRHFPEPDFPHLQVKNWRSFPVAIKPLA